jgi:hypothetical protein
MKMLGSGLLGAGRGREADFDSLPAGHRIVGDADDTDGRHGHPRFEAVR